MEPTRELCTADTLFAHRVVKRSLGHSKESLREAGQNPHRVLALAEGDAAGRSLDAETDRARELGTFGSPTFVVGDELFSGDDRLEDATSWSRCGCVRRG